MFKKAKFFFLRQTLKYLGDNFLIRLLFECPHCEEHTIVDVDLGKMANGHPDFAHKTPIFEVEPAPTERELN